MPNKTNCIPVLYEDQDILVVDKPCSVLVHPSGKPGQLNVVEHFQEIRRDPEIRPVHRLDRMTSGVLLLAKSAANARFFGRLFTRREMEKTYLAEVRGKLTPASGTLDRDLGKDYDSAVAIRRKTVDVGEKAITQFQCVWRGRDSSYVKLKPETGRRHQLRVHMADMGHPIINDPIYDLGDEHYLDLIYATEPSVPMHLHAWKLRIEVPSGGEKEFAAPKPPFWPESHGIS